MPSALQQPDLDLASVVRVTTRHPKWTLLQDDEPLALLHSKFWGKSLLFEEPLGRSGQPHASPHGSELGDETQRMDVDDDDVIPGPSILNIGIGGLPFSKIFIRADYIRIYDFLDHRETIRFPNGLAPAAVLTGHPGTGKSVWVSYAICRRLVDRKATIWYRDHTCYLFVREGVFEAPANFPSSYFLTFVWTLVDSDESKEGVPSHLMTPGTRLYVIYVTSPRQLRWSRMGKTTRKVTVIMNPWTRKELSYAASIYRGGNFDEQVNRVYDQFGPTPRLCIDYLLNPLEAEEYEDEVRKAVTNITSQKLEILFDESGALNMGNLSHKICLISRENRDDVASLPIVKPITPNMHSRLVCQFRKLERQEQVRMYKRFAKTRDSKAVAGIAFEAAGQVRLQDGMDLELLPMVHLSLQSREDSLPQWYSSHLLLCNAELERLRQNALRHPLMIQVLPSRIIEYGDDGLSSIESDVFYLPQITNRVAFDVFILLNGILYLFQFTIAESHVIKLGLKDFLTTCPNIPNIENWRFIFVIPPNQTLICPQPGFLDTRGIPMYSTVMAL